MQLGHYAERDIINLKSNQLQREKKFQVLYSKSNSLPLVFGEVNQFYFVFLVLSSLDFSFPTINNRGR